MMRVEEKLLLEEFRRRKGVEVVVLDDRALVFDLDYVPEFDVVFERCINHSRALYSLRLLESAGLPA